MARSGSHLHEESITQISLRRLPRVLSRRDPRLSLQIDTAVDRSTDIFILGSLIHLVTVLILGHFSIDFQGWRNVEQPTRV